MFRKSFISGGNEKIELPLLSLLTRFFFSNGWSSHLERGSVFGTEASIVVPFLFALHNAIMHNISNSTNEPNSTNERYLIFGGRHCSRRWSAALKHFSSFWITTDIFIYRSSEDFSCQYVTVRIHRGASAWPEWTTAFLKKQNIFLNLQKVLLRLRMGRFLVGQSILAVIGPCWDSCWSLS